MSQLSYQIDERGRGQFMLIEGTIVLGKMVVAVTGSNLIVFHTEVGPAQEGHGLARQIMDYVVAYAREHKLEVVPLCSYVLGQFKKTPTDFEDVWKRTA